MNTNNTNCSTCGGRKWNFKSKPCPCACPLGTAEYPYKVAGCIRNKNPECPYNAVIASVHLDTREGIDKLRDCFVHVMDINTTYYVDDKGRIMTIWAGPVELSEYDVAENPLKLRSQFLYTVVGGKNTVFYFDKTGIGHKMFEEN